MSWLQHLKTSSIGAKFLLAITGLLLALFLIAHLSGNLLILAGAESFNAYAHKLKSLGALLWVARLGLLAVFIAHIYLAIRLNIKNKQARPIGYRIKQTVQATVASRTMVLSGLLILAFVLFHLAHYTFYWIDPEVGQWVDQQGRHDAYRMVIHEFSEPGIVVTYVFFMLVLGMHLSHGLTQFWQSLGLYHDNFTPCLQKISLCVAWLIALGFCALPLAVMTGLVH